MDLKWIICLHTFLLFYISASVPHDQYVENCKTGLNILPKLFIIGSQKGGTSSLYSDLKSSYQGRIILTACRNRHDPKECNVFSTHSTLGNLYHSFGTQFCRPGGTTANYCKLLQGRGFKSSSYFTSLYDSCNVSSASPLQSCLDPASDKSSCVPLIGVDASPTYATRPHVRSTSLHNNNILKNVIVQC